MDNTIITNNNMLKNKITIPFVVSLIGILILTISIFLPYMTAIGDFSDYINTYSNTIAIEDSDVTLGDLAKVPFISVSKLIESVWGEDDAQITDIFLVVFGGFTILTMIFTFFKKPILAMICNILTCGTFLLLSTLIKEDFIDDDKYIWGIGYYAILIALIFILIGLILMLVFKIIQKKQQNLAKDQL